jgi:hypothetical protein
LCETVSGIFNRTATIEADFTRLVRRQDCDLAVRPPVGK